MFGLFAATPVGTYDWTDITQRRAYIVVSRLGETSPQDLANQISNLGLQQSDFDPADWAAVQAYIGTIGAQSNADQLAAQEQYLQQAAQINEPAIVDDQAAPANPTQPTAQDQMLTGQSNAVQRQENLKVYAIALGFGLAGYGIARSMGAKKTTALGIGAGTAVAGGVGIQALRFAGG